MVSTKEDANTPKIRSNLFELQEEINIVQQSINSRISRLRDQEIKRLYHEYIAKDTNAKNLEKLSKTLLYLFGRDFGEKVYLKFTRMKQVYHQHFY